eukprot:2669330-Amphidinium_carterae.1
MMVLPFLIVWLWGIPLCSIPLRLSGSSCMLYTAATEVITNASVGDGYIEVLLSHAIWAMLGWMKALG